MSKLLLPVSIGALAVLSVIASGFTQRIPYTVPAAAGSGARTRASVIAFVDVAVIPMDRETVLPDQTVLVAGGRITALGPTRQVHVPDGAARIDGRGKFLLPGLADMHAHLFTSAHIATVRSGPVEMQSADSAAVMDKLLLWLANGVTTIRDMDYANEMPGKEARRLRALAETGTVWIPHMYTAGQWGPFEYLSPALSSVFGKPVLGRISGYVTAYKAAGYDFLKIHDEAPDVLDSVLAAAKRVGLPVSGHVPPPVQVEHVLWGYRSIEHPVNDYFWGGHTQRDPRDTVGIGVLAAAMHKAGVWNCPTQQHYDRLHYIPQLGTSPRVLKTLQDSGVKLLLGTDELPWRGVISEELHAMVAAGLTPYQALLTGTRNVAEYLGTLDHSGTIAAGKRADLVLLTGNPLLDVRYTAQPAGVMLGGRWLPRAELERLVATLTLPTFTSGKVDLHAPVKSYWQNMADRALESAKPLFYNISLSDTQRTQYQTLQMTHHAQWQALVDSLGEEDHYAAGAQRIVDLLAKQLRADRKLLTAEQRVRFDGKLTTWVNRNRAEGYSVTAPDAQP